MNKNTQCCDKCRCFGKTSVGTPCDVGKPHCSFHECGCHEEELTPESSPRDLDMAVIDRIIDKRPRDLYNRHAPQDTYETSERSHRHCFNDEKRPEHAKHLHCCICRTKPPQDTEKGTVPPHQKQTTLEERLENFINAHLGLTLKKPSILAQDLKAQIYTEIRIASQQSYDKGVKEERERILGILDEYGWEPPIPGGELDEALKEIKSKINHEH